MAEDEEKARAEAEARRLRIMEKSRDRMNKVAGLQAAEEEDDEETTKKSSAARMQAMRRRRFKKGGKAKEERAAADGTAEETSSEPAPVAATASTVETKKDDTVTKEKDATKISAAADTEKETSEEPKKYKGVAKMRREKMLQKKKEEASKAAEEEAKGVELPPAVARRRQTAKTPVLPILMYIFTTILLFLAGLDVGLQHADDGILVNREFTPQHFSVEKLIPKRFKSSTIQNLESDNELYSRDLSEQDEFSTSNEEDYRDIDAPNIDPLFRVDLDELTKGPGIFMQMARGAVKIHRMILFVVWEVPLQFFALPAQLFQFPPVMCLAALTIRQVISKLVLGAKLPEKAEDDVRNTKEMQDVLTMIKNAVKNTVVGAFPTAVSMYDTFQSLRADMYVVLCGVFVGLLYSSMMIQQAAAPQEDTEADYGQEEEVSTPEPDTPAAGGLSDEL